MIDFNTIPQVAPEVSLEDLFEAGCHFGHQSKKWHPKMAPWIYAEQDGVHIFDLEKTAAQLKKAYNYAYYLGLNKKNLVVVGTKKQAGELVEKMAQEAGAMYISHRWMGGLVSNWDQVGKSVKRMNEIENGLASGKFNDYTKYERTMMAKELERLQRFFGGIKELKKYPDAVFIVDVLREKNAVKEILTEKIPTLALIDSNSNPTGIDVPVPANDDALSSIQTILSFVLAGYKAGKEGKRLSTEAAPATTTAPEVTQEETVVEEKKTVVKEKANAEVKKEVKEEKKKESEEVKKVEEAEVSPAVEKKAAVKKAPVKKPAAKKVVKKETTKK